ncbi:sugar ABC transporter permease [Chryseoglobus sp. KN1116]|uniref:Sugar ABC transporter permease n=1 Tax=Microcella pacifica TaxID=2591847 RepID=A0A9E5JNW7_9MICO|nr:sugar ABC transporter permease [Microcella pacifica]
MSSRDNGRGVANAAPRSSTPPKSALRTFRRSVGPVVPIVPAAAIMAVFFVGPILWAVYVGFTDQGLTGAAALNPQWVWFDNFERLINDRDAHAAISRTVAYVLLVVAGQNVLGLALALLLQKRNKAMKTIASGAVVLAWVLPEVVVAMLWYAFLNTRDGTLNTILASVGLPGQSWLIDQPLFAIVIASVWRGTAFSLLIYSAALEEVSPESIEAAQVDGASGMQQLFYVVLPSISRLILTNLLLTTLQTLGVFGLIFALTGGGPGGQTQTLPLYMYEQAFRYNLIGYSSVIAIVLVVLGVILSAFYLYAFRKGSK